jgi:hypothetical protein
MNLENCKAWVTLLEEANRDPDHIKTTKWVLAILYKGKQDLVVYYAEFYSLIIDLDWNDIVNWAA